VTWLDEIELKGERRGRKAERAEVLLEQIQARFGAVPADARARIQAADAADLGRWVLRVLTASSLAEVFATTASKAAPARKVVARKTAVRKTGRRV
jgi:hypothetical protein